ncbi:hypothetical protein [Dethiothermospora halolimnae]|uniref:hypothetical protein n=1 Tax=Dethiothermospora halolimnae TaxID=3114390 RepID=UPI003CCBF48B
MGKEDKRNRLEDNIFEYRAAKSGKVFIYWYGKQVSILKGKKAEKFLKKVANADEKQRQLIMAKVTGNFKRGNEKLAKR